MIGLDEAPKTYEDAVQTLARWHGEGPFDDIVIYAVDGLETNGDSTVRLIEVSAAFGRTNELHPVVFGRSAYMPFKTAVLLVTPDEFERIQRRDMELPEGFRGPMRRVWPRD